MKSKGKVIKSIILLIIIFVSIWYFSHRENQEKLVALIENIKIGDMGTRDISFNMTKSIPIEGNIIDVGNYGGMVLWDGKSLTKIKDDGEAIKERSFNFEEVGIYMGDKYIYIFEKPAGEIYVLDSNLNIVDKIKTENPVENVVESFDNIIIHIKEVLGESIKILNKNREVIEKIITENRNILNYAVNTSGDKYIISTLDLQDSKIKSQVQGFKIGGDELFSHEFQDEIVLYTKYIDRDKFILATDSNLYCISQEEILWNQSYNLLKDIHLINEDIYILYSNTLEVVSKDGDIKSKFNLSEEYNKILVYKNHIVLYGPEYIIGLNEENEVFKFNSEDNIIKAVKDNEKIIILYDDKMELRTFK